jgi:hypothetical protein
MSVIKFQKPTFNMIHYIAENMRDADRAEIWASHRKQPIESLMTGWTTSAYSAIVTVNDVPCVMLGLVRRDLLSDYGVPWLLGTNGAIKHRREFLRLSPPVIQEMLSVCPKLYNYVHVDNKVSIDWLRWLGFTFDEPQPYGVTGELFHKFHMELKHV